MKGVDFGFLAENGGLYTRWDPCKDPITYQIDTTVAPTAGRGRRRSRTPSPPHRRPAATRSSTSGRSPARRRRPGVDAVIGYRALAVGNLGSGGGTPNANLELVQGTAYVQSGMPPDGRRLSLIHEIGHLLGLAHITDSTEVMFGAAVVPYFQDYQRGDLEGMRLVGASMPCFPAS